MATWPQFRILIVSMLATLLLSLPFSMAESSAASSARVEAFSDLSVGLSQEIYVDGVPNQFVEVLLESSEGKRLLINGKTDEKGRASLVLSPSHLSEAGGYTLQARHVDAKESFGVATSFEVRPGQASSSLSEVFASSNVARLGETLEVNVLLRDSFGNPLEGHVLSLESDFDSVLAKSVQSATNENGVMTFMLESQEAGLFEVMIEDKSSGTVLDERVKLAFVTDSDGRGGDDDLILTAGPLAGFEIESNVAPIMGTPFTVNVKAIDELGETVSDYTGTIRFSSTDPEATLPNDYTFRAEDLGEHEFSLAVTFLSPGEQLLLVTDTDEFTITGQIDVNIQEEAGVDTGDNFVVDDFTREGDFTLDSPVSGSYSLGSLDIEGGAAYGNYAVAYLNDNEVGRVEIDFDDSFSIPVTNVEDGDYTLRVDIVELEDGDVETAEVANVLESSQEENIVIDTSAPTLVSLSVSPEGPFVGQQEVLVTVLSEADMTGSTLEFNDGTIPLQETQTDGKYEATLLMPNRVSEFPLDVRLVDELGNDVLFRDQFNFNVESLAPELSSDLPAPTGVVASVSGRDITLSWQTPDTDISIANYKVEYGPSADALFASQSTLDSAPRITILDLVPDADYFLQVKTVALDGTESEASLLVSARTESPAPVVTVVPAEPTPPIAHVELPPSTPESGPEHLALIVISLLASALLTRVRSRGGFSQTHTADSY